MSAHSSLVPAHSARPPRILFTGGGTGGHVYPAIAIADAVKKQCPEAILAFAGSQDKIEWTAVPQAGYPIYPIRVQGIVRSFSARNIAKNLRAPFAVTKGLLQAWSLIGGFDADAAVGTGGYVSGPVIWAAHLRKRPVLIQEQNAHVGVTNKILARVADRIHTAFVETLKVFPANRTTVSGNPTRDELVATSVTDARAFFGLKSHQRMLLILGGSGGSKPMNDAVLRNLRDLLDDENLVIAWQTGKRYVDEVSKRVDEHPRVKLLEFIDRMDYAYAAADLAICRAGASTCSELLITGTPSILVPSPYVAEDHQTKNAQSLVKMGAAKLLPELRLVAEFYDTWKSIWDDQDVLQTFSERALENSTPHAADEIAADVLRLARRRAA